MSNSGSVLLFSGGMDSTLVLRAELGAGRKVLPIFFSYGQANYESEVLAARRICEYYDVPLVEHNLGLLEVSETGDYYFRNLIMISMAANLARSLGINQVITGIRESDFPDTSFWFVNQVQAIINTLSDGLISVYHPIFSKDRKQVVNLLMKLGVPLNYTYSCFGGNKPCGKCATCKELAKVLAPSIFDRGESPFNAFSRTKSNDGKFPI